MFSKQNFNPKNKAFKEVVFISGEKGRLFNKTCFGLKENLQAGEAIFACHGGDGENGKLVTFFEKHGISCSAGSPNALAICMDKFLFKKTMIGLKVPVVSGTKITRFDFENNFHEVIKAVKYLGFPLVLKINTGGSSIGLFIAENLDEFKQKIVESFEFDDNVIVEKFIANNREFNVALLGDEFEVEVSDIDEPIKNNDVLSFADKYLSGNSKSSKGTKNSMASQNRKFPAEISKELELKIKNTAKKIFVGLGLRGIVRIDFLYDEANDKLYVCEVNAIPGSLAFYFFKKNKILCNSLVERLIEIADNHKNNNYIKPDFVTNILDEI